MHRPVLLKELLHFLDCQPGRIYADCTLGLGGHALAVLERISPSGLLLGIDKDPEALEVAKKKLARFTSIIHLRQADFCELGEIAQNLGIEGFNGIYFDLGMSSYQIEHSKRGFSFNKDEELDMRFDPSMGKKASKFVNTLPQNQLESIFYSCGEKRWARRIARAICERRKKQKIYTTRDLSNIVANAIPRKYWPKKIHPATKIFMALRILVNRELNRLLEVLPLATHLLLPGGKLAIISFHSLEDRIVKNFFRDITAKKHDQKEEYILHTPKPVGPKEHEIQSNPRARSARLRVIERKK